MAGTKGGPTRSCPGGPPSPCVQPRSRTGRRAGGALDLEGRFGGQSLIKTCCTKLKKTPPFRVCLIFNRWGGKM